MSASWLKRLITSVIGILLIALSGGGQIAGATSNPGEIANYNGGTLNLADGWGGAAVCAVTATGTFCFSSQADYLSWRANMASATETSLTPNLNCSSALELFSGTNYTGTEVSIFDEGVWINLSTYGFGDETKSYKVGACQAGMTSAANGGGTAYPGPMTAGTDASSMESGWADRIESAYVV
jgi:hypothetical protein